MADTLAAKVPDIIEQGMSEIEFAGLLEAHARSLGHQGLIRMRMWDNDLLRAHDVMLEIQEKVKQKAIPGSVSGQLYDMMVSMADNRGYKDYFMGTGDRKIRFTGHGLGLELDEFPFIAKGQALTLEKGMMIALEPKVVFPEKGVVGIENTLLVTDNGLESLTTFSDKITIL